MDKIKYEILEDGTLSVETEGISGKNHMSADELLASIQKALGGKTKIKLKVGHAMSHSHSHAHGEEHHHH
jgi:hypothetical protein